jgi:hypothetical protein
MINFINYKPRPSTLIAIGIAAGLAGIAIGEILGLNQTIANRNGLVKGMAEFVNEKGLMDEMTEYLDKLDKVDGLSYLKAYGICANISYRF